MDPVESLTQRGLSGRPYAVELRRTTWCGERSTFEALSCARCHER
jgi:hypothetical protein